MIGSSGFIGTHLVESLKKKGHQVTGLDLPAVDITDLGELLKIENVFCNADCIYHLAVLPLNNCNMSPRRCIETNVLGTANVMEVARLNGVRRVIYASASSVYGNPETLPVGEEAPKHPLTIYGATKLAAENVIHAMSRDLEPYLTYGIFRLTNVYGPGQKNGLIPSVISNILNGTEVCITGDGKQTRDFVYVDDVVELMIRAMDTPLYSFTANLGSGSQVSVNRVVDMCEGYLALHANRKYVPYDGDRKEFRADLTKVGDIFGERKVMLFGDGLFDTVQSWKPGSRAL